MRCLYIRLAIGHTAGARLPIPSGPGPRQRLWMTPQGATPAKRIQHTMRPDDLNIKYELIALIRASRLHLLQNKTIMPRPTQLAGFNVMA